MLKSRLTGTVVAALLAPLAAAQTPVGGGADAASADEPLPEYQIEVIVFAHRDFNPSEEDFDHEREVPALPPSAAPLAEVPPSLVPVFTDPAAGGYAGDGTALGDEPFGRAGDVIGESTNAAAPGTLASGDGADELPAASNGLDPIIYGDPFAPEAESDRGTELGVAVPPAAAPNPAPQTLPTAAADAPRGPLVAVPGAPGEAPFYFRLLAPEEYALDDLYARLERLSAYAPLLHGGWVQPGFPEGATHPFDLSLLGASTPRGTLELYVSRFLHLNVDLSYQPDAAYAWTESDSSGLGTVSLPERYTLHAERRLRSGEIHYFDHPAFGVLVQIRPQPAAKPEDKTQPAA